MVGLGAAIDHVLHCDVSCLLVWSHPAVAVLHVRRALWKAEEQQGEVCNTSGLALYTRPRPESVAALALSIF